MIDINKIKEEIDKYEHLIREDRIARGLPPERPEKFLPVTISVILCEKLAHLYPIFVKYTKLTYDSQTLIPFDVSYFDKYRDIIDLLSLTVNTECLIYNAGIKGAINTIEEVNEALSKGDLDKDPIKVATKLYLCLSIMGSNPPTIDCAYDYKSDMSFYEQIKPYKEEYERLKTDEALFNAEVEKYRKRYDEIKHLL